MSQITWHPVTVFPTDENGENVLTTDGTHVELAGWQIRESGDSIYFWYEGVSHIARGTETHWAELPDPPSPTPNR